jgi:hypothetical protein
MAILSPSESTKRPYDRLFVVQMMHPKTLRFRQMGRKPWAKGRMRILLTGMTMKEFVPWLDRCRRGMRIVWCFHALLVGELKINCHLGKFMKRVMK